MVLTGLTWEAADRAGEILLQAENLPGTSFAVLESEAVPGTPWPGYPLPVVAAPGQIALLVSELLENLSGQETGPYEILAPAGPHSLGRLYWARHHQLQRPVQILVPPVGSAAFGASIHNLARLNHPSVYALYESISWQSRTLVAMEPIIHPSLLHLGLRGESPSLLACARLAESLGSVLEEMGRSGLPARLLGAYDYTLLPSDLPRLRNPAALPGQETAETPEQAAALATFLEPVLAETAAGQELLGLFRRPRLTSAELLREAREVTRQLAEVRELHVRQEEREAVRQTLRARKIRRWLAVFGAAGFLALASAYAWVIFRNFILDVPAHLNPVLLDVPAGAVTRSGESLPVAAFALDRHEVTIGEYEKFLAAVATRPDWATLLPPGRAGQKQSPEDFQPRDWPNILRAARKNADYQGQKISRDTPVFNVDFASAHAYARHHGRRLPTLLEWQRAAGGEDARPYPWGREAGAAVANLGLGRTEPTRQDGSDGFFNAAPAETFPGDRGPFGHLDLGGNLSEWVDLGGRAAVAGGNFTDPNPVSNEQARRQDPAGRDPPASSQLDVIGFRTAR